MLTPLESHLERIEKLRNRLKELSLLIKSGKFSNETLNEFANVHSLYVEERIVDFPQPAYQLRFKSLGS